MQKTIVITGAASGIGLACARLFKAAGARVIGLDINTSDEALDRFIPVDLSDEASITRAAAAIDEPVDVLCNIAGLPGSAPAEKIMAVNVIGLRTFMQALLPRINRGGAILNLASLAGSGWRDRLAEAEDLLATDSFAEGMAWVQAHPRPAADAYRFSKECVIVATAKWAAQLQAYGLRTISFSPGPVQTPILENFRKSMAPGQVDVAIDLVGRAATAEDIAQVIVAVADDGMQWLNGIDIPTDGGLSAMRRYGQAAA